MAEIMIFVGQSHTNGPLETCCEHGDIICINPDGFQWGTEERERALILRIPDISVLVQRKFFSSDYNVLSSQINAKKSNKFSFIDTDDRLARFRSYVFDLAQLTQGEQDYIEEKRQLGHDNHKLYTAGMSNNVVLATREVILKEALDPVNLSQGEEYITGYKIRELAGEIL